MTQNNEEQNEVKKENELVSSEQLGDGKNSNSHISNHLITGLAFIVAVTAVFVAIYTMQLNKQLQKTMLTGDRQLLVQLEHLKQTQQENLAQLKEKTSNMDQVKDELQNKVGVLEKQIKNETKQFYYQKQDWQLLKARYYLELAQINTFWSTDYKASIALLQNSDTLLKEVNEPQILKIRQALAKEINLIQSIPGIDIAGLLSQIDAMQQNISTLHQQSTESAENPAQTEAQSTSAWKSRMQESIHLLEKLVVVRRDNQNIKPLMSPLLESALRETIHLNLQEAQWAILNNNSEVYQLALKQAQLNIKRGFSVNNPIAAVLMKQLSELQEIKITQEKPTIGAALALLNQLIRTEKQLIKQTQTNGKEGNKP